MASPRVTAIAGRGRSVGAAVDAFLGQPWPATTLRTYDGTLSGLTGELGRSTPLASVTDGELTGAAVQLWGTLAPRTWNRHCATIRSFLSWCRREGWPVGDLELRADRRAVPDDETRAIPLRDLELLWGRPEIALRERALWRLLYDSAARAEEVLGLDVTDIDVANRQARATTKGGHTRLLHFQTGAARLLVRVIGGRESGPVFLTARRASAHRVTAAADLDPATGRARLSYEQAEQLFKRYSGGRTLHALRHSRLTHLGEQNVSAPLLMAMSGHRRLATLQIYVRPGPAAVAAALAARDPERRRR